MKDLSDNFSLYIHIPFCVSKCAYCDFLSFACRDKMEGYFSALANEIRVWGRKIDRKVDNVYFGGGTPSIAYRFFPMIRDALKESFVFDRDAEVSMECNPESVTNAFLDAARDLGVNRISLGVQTLSDPLLKRIGRAHDALTARKALSLLVGAFDHVNVDVMVGLPGQRCEDVVDTIEELTAYPIEHLSCYSLIVERGTPLAEWVRRGKFRPDEDFAADLYDLSVSHLFKAGFDRYEISNFCRDGRVCRYNASVWQYADYLGIGLGASSFMKKEDVAFSARRWHNTRDLDRYILKDGDASCRKQRIDATEGRKECIMLALRTAEGLDLRHFNEWFQGDFYAEYREKLNKLSPYLIMSKDHLAIKPEYFYISNSIIAELF